MKSQYAPRFCAAIVSPFHFKHWHGLSPIALAYGVLSLDGATEKDLSIVLSARIFPMIALMLFGVVIGILNALWWPATSGVLPAIVPKEKLKDGNALVGLLSNFGYVVGALLGGTIVTIFGSGPALLADALSFLGAGILIWRLDVPPMEKRVRTSVFTEFNFGNDLPRSYCLKYHLSRPLFFALLVIALASAWDFSLALKSPLPLTLCGTFLAGIAIEIIKVNWCTALQSHIPEESFSRVTAYDAFGSFALAPLGIVVSGPLAMHYGVHTVLWFTVAITLISALLALLVKSVRGL